MKPLVSRKIINMIHVDDAKPQAERSRSFSKGLEALMALWRNAWIVSAKGMKRAHWRDDINIEDELDEVEDSIDFEAFKAAAHSRSGSRDLGAQLFCALLRSIAIDTRLVCSLQVLPFSAVAKGQTPKSPNPPTPTLQHKTSAPPPQHPQPVNSPNQHTQSTGSKSSPPQPQPGSPSNPSSATQSTNRAPLSNHPPPTPSTPSTTSSPLKTTAQRKTSPAATPTPSTRKHARGE